MSRGSRQLTQRKICKYLRNQREIINKNLIIEKIKIHYKQNFTNFAVQIKKSPCSLCLCGENVKKLRLNTKPNNESIFR